MADQESKLCCRCKQALQRTLFSPDARASDGKQSRCKPCSSQAKRERYQADPEAARERQRAVYERLKTSILSGMKKYREQNADLVRERKRMEYMRNKQDPAFLERLRQYTADTKGRKKAYDRSYRLANADKLEQTKKSWRAKHQDKVTAIRKAYKARRRQLEAGGDSTQAIAAWEKRAPKVCYWCSSHCADSYHLDHYVALSKGGKHEVANLVIACPPCNIKKNARDPYEFAREVGRLF